MTDTAFRLAEILATLDGVGVSCLVHGGHAARYYGVERTASDFDLHFAPDGWPDLPERLARSPLFAGRPAIEGSSWRPNDFRRFQIGRLPDGPVWLGSKTPVACHSLQPSGGAARGALWCLRPQPHPTRQLENSS